MSVPSAAIINPSNPAEGLPSSYNPTDASITSLVGSGGIPDVAGQTQFSLKLLF